MVCWSMEKCVERFIGIIYDRDTTTLPLNNGITGLLTQYFLSQSCMYRQCFDGKINMQGDIIV